MSRKNAKGADDVARLLEQGLQNVVYRRGVEPPPSLLARLEALGFQQAYRSEHYVLYTRVSEKTARLEQN